MEYITPEIKCELCGQLMSGRVNGSHLKSKHSITIEEYVLLYPNAVTGSYSVRNFTCCICNESITNMSAVKSKHIRNHGLSVDEYNQKYLQKNFCLCGCGELTEYSYSKKRYKDYISGHASSWNKGLLKADGHNMAGGGWNRGMTKDTDVRVYSQSLKIKELWDSGKIDKQKSIDSYQKTMLEKYGVTNYSLTDEFKIKAIASSLMRYGVEYPMQSAKIYSLSKKGRFKFKKYKWPSGKVSDVQGYEPYALDILLQTFSEEDLEVDKALIPEIWYDLNGKRHRYFPDIYIKTENKIIEVKSVYTYRIDKDILDVKKKEVREQGYGYEIWIIENKTIKEIL